MAVAMPIIAGLGLGTQLYMGREQQEEAKRAMRRQERRQRELEAEAQKRLDMQEAASARDLARQAQAYRMASSGGLDSTIRTSPLGIPGNAAATGQMKTLLGS